MSLRGRDIVCVGIADWHNDLQTNDQHLLRRLSGENRILFIESLGLRQPQLAGRDLSRIWRRLRNGLRPPRMEDGVNVLSPLVLPFPLPCRRARAQPVDLAAAGPSCGAAARLSTTYCSGRSYPRPRY